MITEICTSTGARPALVYLAEAHASDIWPLSVHASPSHVDVQHRLAVAKGFVAEHPEFASLIEDRLYIDMFDNETTLRYGLWPERYLLLEADTVRWFSTLNLEHRMTGTLQEMVVASSTMWVT